MLDGEDKVVDSAVRGEASAFGLLYDHYQPMIYRFVLVKTSRREDAEDLTHQVFLSAWQNIRTYADLGFPFSSWLYRIARNQVIDHYRTKKKDVSLDDVDPDYFAAHPQEDLRLEQKLQIERVAQAIKSLKPEYQDVVLMRFVEELSPKEIAHALEKTEGAVKVMQHRALRQIKMILVTRDKSPAFAKASAGK